MPMPKDIIEAIKNRQVTSDKEFVLDSLSGAIDRLQKAFPRYGSFIMEFIQNADDAESNSLLFEISLNNIKIFNDGLPFIEKDIKNICKIGRSSKTVKDYIGYLGVGFKSVFLISDSPEIYSGDFRFKFSKTDWGDPKHIPWQIIPLWIDTPITTSNRYKTTFNIPVKSHEIFTKLIGEMKPEHLNNRILLFLRNIDTIEVVDLISNIDRKIIKSKVNESADYQIFQIQETIMSLALRM